MKELLIILVCFSTTGLSAKNELLNTTDCLCPGVNYAYFTCTVNGGLFTIWRGGTLFGGCEIILRHSNFGSGTATGACNNGAVIAQGVTTDSGCYTSQLTFTPSFDIQGQILECAFDDGTRETVVNRTTIHVTQESPPPPNIASVSVSNTTELVFEWTPVDITCPLLNYTISTMNCGTCHTDSSTTICTDFVLGSTNSICRFCLQSVICGNVTGNESISKQFINLRVPEAPVVHVVPVYISGQLSLLSKLVTTFIPVESFTISTEIKGSAISYSITYFDSTFGSICGSVTIPDDTCEDGLCSHEFDIFESSFCPPRSSIIVTVFATNVLGRGPNSVGVSRDGLNSVVNVTFDSLEKVLICKFSRQLVGISKACKANITYGNNCERQLSVYEGEGTGDAVSTQQLETVPDVTEYCFVVTAISNNVTVMVEGNLLNIGSTRDNTAATVVPLALLLLLVLVTVPIAVLVYKFVSKQVRDYSVMFSVEDKPGYLAKVLKVFKDNKVNILGVNTHLHHAAFDRDAGNGYRYNHIHCLCSEEDKQFLQRTFDDTEFVGMDQEHTGGGDKFPLTAIIKVKDKLGGLWEVLDTIGNQGINLLGVNTRTERESKPGYKDNYVRCSCSTDDIQKLETGLRDIGVINIRIEFHVQKDFQTKAIKYLVRDEVGALARTLEIFSTLGLNISGVNLEHMGNFCRKTVHGHKLNFVECSINDATKEKLFKKLKTDYGAIDVEFYEVPQTLLDTDTDYKIVKITIQDEKGSLNRILKAFSDLQINLHGVNVLYPAFTREVPIDYKHYHLEITATSDQERELRDRLYGRGLAIHVMPFNLNNCACTDTAKLSVPNQTASNKPDDTERKVVSDRNPQTKTIEFSVRDKVGALANALQIFGELGINITKVNPAHLSQEHKSEYVECNCEPGKRESLIKKLETYGATKAEILPEKEVPQGMADAEPNYCVVTFSVGNELGAIVKVLKAFPELGVNIIKVNPSHIKLQNQYVECCCDGEVRTSVVKKLKTINGVTHVRILPEGEATTSHRDPNYCVIKFTVGEAAGILVRALRVFFDNDINIIGVNSLNPTFERKSIVTFKQNNVVFLATGDQVSELKHKLLVTGVALDVEEYEYKAQDDTQPINKNEIELTGIRVHLDSV